MRTLLTYLIDTLFPPSAETLLVRRLTVEDVTRLYEPRPIDDIVALASFSSPVIRALIHEAKFKDSTQAAILLAHLLRTHLTAHPDEHNSVFVPIPLSRERSRERGYNQVSRVLRALSENDSPILIDETILARTRHTRSQTELGREERLVNLHGAFTVPTPTRIPGASIVLVDDVTTTGTTLHEAKHALLPYHPRRVTCIALAH